MADSGVLGEVARVASTGASTGHTAATAAPPNGRPKKRKRSRRVSIPEDAGDVAVYAHHLERYSESFYAERRGRNQRWLHGASDETRIASSTWSNTELTLLFQSLARRSRLRPDLISEDLGGSKTSVEVETYLTQLAEAARSVSRSSSVILRGGNGAREMSEAWVKREEELAQQLQHPRAGDAATITTTHNEQVSNAVLFLHSHRKKKQHVRNVAVGGTSLPTFSIKELAKWMHCHSANPGHGPGTARKEYRVFARTHDVPVLRNLSGGKPGRPRSVKRKKGGLQNGAVSCIVEEASPISGTTTHRVLLRAIELGLLLVVTDNDLSALSHTEAKLKFKNRNVTSSQQESIPTGYISSIMVAFAADLPGDEAMARSSIAFKGWRLAQRTRADALQRLLASVTHEELEWIAACADFSKPVTAATAPPTPTGESSVAATAAVPFPTSSPDQRSSETFHGYSLVGMDAKERERFKARIRARELKYGSNSEAHYLSRGLLPTDDGRSIAWNRGKTRVLAAFQDKLQHLEGADRRRAMHRLRKQVRTHGLLKALESEYGASRAAQIQADFEKSAACPGDGDGDGASVDQDDADAQNSPFVVDDAQIASADSVKVTSPRLPASASARFVEIGHTRSMVLERLQYNSESGILNLKAIAKALAASTMTSCTRPDDFDSLIDQDQPLRISLLETIPRLQEELQAFVARVVVSAGDEVAAGEQAVTDLHVRLALARKGLPTNLTALRKKEAGSHDETTLERVPSHHFLANNHAGDDTDNDDDDDESEGEEMSDAIRLQPFKSLRHVASRVREAPDAREKDSSDSDASSSHSSADELFESHYEAAQVAHVRREWRTRARETKKATHSATLRATGGFYWPDEHRRLTQQPITHDAGDVMSDSDGDGVDNLESDDQADAYASSAGVSESSDESDSASARYWARVHERDRGKDVEYEKRNWTKWLGSMSEVNGEPNEDAEDRDARGEEASLEAIGEAADGGAEGQEDEGESEPVADSERWSSESD